MSTMPTKKKAKDLRDEMTNFQKGYSEGVEIGLQSNVITRPIKSTLIKSLGMSESEKRGFDQGMVESAKAQAYESMERTNQVRSENEDNYKKLRVKK